MIAFCTTCKGRAQHLKATLPKNLADNADYFNAKFIVLDYGSQDGLFSWLALEHWKDIESGRLVVYHHPHWGAFHMAHAKNMAARLGILEGADILVTLDADNFTGPGFAHFVAGRLTDPGIFLCPDYVRIKSLPHGPGRPQRGYAGRLAIRAQEFIKMGGYDETFDTWRGEDIDMIERLKRTGYTIRMIDNCYLNAIPHGPGVRFKEYPHARQYDNAGEFHVIKSRPHTVVNYGKFGCGPVRDHFAAHFVPRGVQQINLDLLPTRIFGIGLQRTSTSSLHQAFKILGFDSFHWETNQKAWAIWQEMNALGKSITLERYYALCDLPIPMLYRELDAAYPGSKFILTVRSESDWLKSVEWLWDPARNPRYDWNVQPFTHPIHQALYGRTDFDATAFLERYRRHNAEVKEYFRDRPGDLLVMDMDHPGAGWPELCGFLNKPIPIVPYPRANKSEELKP